MAPDGIKGDAGTVMVPIQEATHLDVDLFGRDQQECCLNYLCLVEQLARAFMAAHEARVAAKAELFEAMANGSYWSTRDKADDVAAERLEAAREALFAALKE